MSLNENPQNEDEDERWSGEAWQVDLPKIEVNPGQN